MEEKTYHFQGVVRAGYPSSLCVEFTKVGKTLEQFPSAELPRPLVPADERLAVIGRKASGTVAIINKTIHDLKTNRSSDYRYCVVRTLELAR